MNFASDNTTGAAPEIMAALTAANQGQTMPYGNDDATRRLDGVFSELFETDVRVYPVGTGTAANALSLSVVTPAFGAVYCHETAHVAVDECGAPEMYTGGAKMMPLAGDHGIMTPDSLAVALDAVPADEVHHVMPAALSITQQTECGTHYSVADVAALCNVAHDKGLAVHLDGARFANAVAALGCAPADVTWRAGVDIMSFGATKNGAWAGEAVVVFKPELNCEIARRRMRAGHLFSKMRFASVQLEAYLADGLWLDNARHANDLAARLAEGLKPLPGVSLVHPVDGNQVFAALPEAMASGLQADGYLFYGWDAGGISTVRLVTAFNTSADDVDGFITTAGRYVA
ncbi:MAG: low specificity L-threonine aldolase [Pseudomonadota bacterium]|nr:low specificity L-threonine aldolase [Pseudomonadota bacterium]